MLLVIVLRSVVVILIAPRSRAFGRRIIIHAGRVVSPRRMRPGLARSATAPSATNIPADIAAVTAAPVVALIAVVRPRAPLLVADVVVIACVGPGVPSYIHWEVSCQAQGGSRCAIELVDISSKFSRHAG
jgi:hypothetical protein